MRTPIRIASARSSPASCSLRRGMQHRSPARRCKHRTACPRPSSTIPRNATLMVNSAIGDFECAFGGFVTTEGIATDELQDATITAANWQLDRRDDGIHVGQLWHRRMHGTEGVYTPMSTARWEADQAVATLNGWTDAQVAGVGRRSSPRRTSTPASATRRSAWRCARPRSTSARRSNQKGMFALAEKRFTDAITAAHGGQADRRAERRVRRPSARALVPAQHSRRDRRRAARAEGLRVQRGERCDDGAAVQSRLNAISTSGGTTVEVGDAQTDDREWRSRSALGDDAAHRRRAAGRHVDRSSSRTSSTRRRCAAGEAIPSRSRGTRRRS